ncbi:UMA domain [Trinorchestia longiramus]|nr:UMA domain [Trinorchestia longiramus]
MFSRFFGKSRRSPTLANDGDFEIIGAVEEAMPDRNESSFSIEGATAFQDSSRRSSSSIVKPSVSCEDPMSGVPFKLTIDVDPTSGSRELSAAMAVVSRMQATDWDEFSYTFTLEQSVLQECSTKLQEIFLA